MPDFYPDLHNCFTASEYIEPSGWKLRGDQVCFGLKNEVESILRPGFPRIDWIFWIDRIYDLFNSNQYIKNFEKFYISLIINNIV